MLIISSGSLGRKPRTTWFAGFHTISVSLAFIFSDPFTRLVMLARSKRRRLAIIIGFALNVVYQTLFTLWLDAKERELRDRAGKS
jgi:phosphotransferase system  glucose/maltose/N-acetylglucosamine-specific IIC component